MNERLMRILAKPMLCAAALIWGSSFFVMKNATDEIPTFFLLAIRFSVGAVLLALFSGKKWRSFTPDYLWRGAVIGGFLFLAYSVQTFGLIGTTPSKNAFLTSVYCVIVPFLNWAVLKIKPDRFNLIAAVLCVCGVGLVSLNGDLRVTWGDGLTLISAFFFAAHIIAVAKTSKGKDIFLLTCFQFAFAALYGWILGVFCEDFPDLAAFSPEMLLQLAYLSVMATTVALLFQNVGQVWSDPASASVLLSLESVFGVICSILFAGDSLTLRLGLGFVLIFIAVLVSETKLQFLFKTKEQEA